MTLKLVLQCRRFQTAVGLLWNHYATLGIPKSATQAEVKAAYFKLCKEYHPDSHANNSIKSKKFLQISDAYTVLSNVESRRKYDSGLHRNTSSFNYESACHYRWNQDSSRMSYGGNWRDSNHSAKTGEDREHEDNESEEMENKEFDPIPVTDLICLLSHTTAILVLVIYSSFC